MRENLELIKNKKKEIVDSLNKNSFQMMKDSLIAFLFLSMFSIGFILPANTAAQSVDGQRQARIVQRNTNNAPDTNSSPAATRASYADIVEKVTPAVVTVRSERKTTAKTENSPFGNDPALRELFGNRLPQTQQQPQIERGLGSGVIVESDGLILTNNHVVNGANQVKVDLIDKRTFNAKVIGTDEASDLAVLKIEATNLPTLSLGDSDKVRVGDVVLAIGNPLGLRQTVTSGIISAKGRQTGISDGSFEDFLQTDAAINHGNSGGALVDLNGDLVGINSQILSPSGGSIGIGFAIPANMAKSVMAQLIKGGKVHRGMLGVGIQNVTSELAESFGLKDIRGIIVNSVTPNSPAERAGIKQGDVILTLSGTNVNDVNELRNRVAQTAPGTEVNVGILRNGSEQSIKVRLDEFQARKGAADVEKDNPSAEPATGKLGLSLAPITAQVAAQLGLKDATKGIAVMNVQPGSPADEAGIEQGDVILQVNRQDIKTTEELRTAVTKANGKSILLLISRDGQTLYVTVQM